MLKKVLLGALGLALVGGLGLFVWARSVLGSDRVRTALARQISATLGQPVTIASVSATLFPRIGVTLRGVTIGNSSSSAALGDNSSSATIGSGSPIEVGSLNVAADVRALLSRRVEHATLTLAGARVTLPLPSLSLLTDTNSENAGPVEIVSIDHIVLTEVDIVSGGHTIRGHIEIAPRGQGLLVRNVTLAARDMTLTATGEITNIAGPSGTLAIKGGALDFDQLLTIANDVAASARPPASDAADPPSPAAPRYRVPAGLPLPTATAPEGLPLPTSASSSMLVTTAKTGAAMNLRITIEAEKATMSGLTLDAVTAQAIATDELVSLSPLAFKVFGGRYEGSLSATLQTVSPTFRWIANLSNIDVARAVAYAGSPETASGTLTGKIDLTGSGTDAAAAMRTARGVVRLDIKDGVVRNLGLVRSVGAATSLSLEGLRRAAMATAAVNTDEPFQRLGGTVTIQNTIATTTDLQFEAVDLSMAAQGTAQLDGRAINLKAQLRLSEDLSREVRSKMLRLSKQEGRVTLPATISGTFAAPSVKVDTGTITRRAITNTATEEAPRLIRRGIGGLIRR